MKTWKVKGYIKNLNKGVGKAYGKFRKALEDTGRSSFEVAESLLYEVEEVEPIEHIPEPQVVSRKKRSLLGIIVRLPWLIVIYPLWFVTKHLNRLFTSILESLR